MIAVKESVSHNEMVVSWVIGDFGDNAGKKSNPPWADIEPLLADAWRRRGTVTIDVIEAGAGSSKTLQVRADCGRAVLTLGIESDSDYTVLSYDDPAAEDERVSVLGDLWNARNVCRNGDVIVRLFDEFYRTGAVSSEGLV